MKSECRGLWSCGFENRSLWGNLNLRIKNVYHFPEVRKSPEGLAFNEAPSLLESIKERYDQVLNLERIQASGQVAYDNGLYLLDYQLSYDITLPSSRSLEPVTLSFNYPVSETFIQEADAALQKELVEENLVLILDGDTINLDESILDNILLNIPLRVLTPEEESGQISLSGNDWEVLSEEDFTALQQEKKEASNPFAQLNGLFDEN